MPDPIRQEKINVGIAIHLPTEEFSSFFETTNKRRIYNFDDEYDSDYISTIFEGFHFEFDTDTPDFEIGDDRFSDIASMSYLTEKTKFYVNEFQFMSVNSITTTDSQSAEDISDLIRTYLYYDQPKSKRISKKNVYQLLNKRINQLELQEHIKKSKISSTAFKSSKPAFDFETPNALVKTLSLDYKTAQRLSSQLKVDVFDIAQASSLFPSKRVDLVLNNNIDDLYFDSVIPEFKDWVKRLSDIKEIHAFKLSDYTEEIEKGNY